MTFVQQGEVKMPAVQFTVYPGDVEHSGDEDREISQVEEHGGKVLKTAQQQDGPYDISFVMLVEFPSQEKADAYRDECGWC